MPKGASRLPNRNQIAYILFTMMEHLRRRPVVLCILDGWGYRQTNENNAIFLGNTPRIDHLWAASPHGLISTCGEDVGLPEGQMGNSEVGHMNIGAGRIVMQDLPRIDQAIETGDLANNTALIDFIGKLKHSGGQVHLMGLLSPGGVHSHQRHMAELANILDAAGLSVLVHAFLDGRDTPPRSALAYVEEFQRAAPKAGIVTVSGRYYAMDRDQRWDRVKLAYETLVDANGVPAKDAIAAIEASYISEVDDEFVEPSVLTGHKGIQDGDGLLLANFRADRVRQILRALLSPEFDGFERRRRPQLAAVLGMTEYADDLTAIMASLFPPVDLRDTLGEVVAGAGLRQLRIAETEKYAHVTFFLNGGREQEFPGETRILVPSPKVATYDLQPEMAAEEVTDRLVEAIEGQEYDLIVVNYANGDMVGHTGNLTAAIHAVETVDACVGRVADAVSAVGGVLVVTADHGNVETMRDRDSGQVHTAHTHNPVPILLHGAPDWAGDVEDGRLSDLAPTVLKLMGLPQPAAMTGRCLLRAKTPAKLSIA